MTTFETIRTVQATNGEEIRNLAVLHDERGYWLHDAENDENMDGLTELSDDSDTSIMDAIRDNGFEIVEEATTLTTINLTGGDLGSEKMSEFDCDSSEI